MKMKCFKKYFAQLVEIVNQMKNEDVSVEDDTCMDRITSALKSLCNKPFFAEQVVDQINKDEKAMLFLSSRHILQSTKDYQVFTCSFIVKLITVFASDNILNGFEKDRRIAWNLCLKSILNNNIANDSADPHFQYACLWSISQLVSCRGSLLFILQDGIDCDKIFDLTNSSSIFVERMSHLVVSKLVTYVQSFHSDEKNEFLRKRAKSILETISLKLQCVSLNTVLKILTECLKLDYDQANRFFNTYLADPISYFEREQVKKELFSNHARVDPVIINFIAALAPFPGWMSCGFLHELVYSSLHRFPTQVGSYTLLSSVAVNTKENTALYCHLLTVPFDIALGKELENFDTKAMTLWVEAVNTAITSTTGMTSVLCHSATAWSKIWKAGLIKTSQTEASVITCFNHILLTVYELNETAMKAKPDLLQNYKVGSTVLECIKVCVDNTGKCWLCVHGDMTSNFLSLMKHVDADFQLLKRCAHILMSFYSNGCVLHSDIKILMSLCEVLIDKMSHLRWQERDTALEVTTLILNTLDHCSENCKNQFEDHLRQLKLVDSLVLRFSDTNSHVRASALTTTKALLESTNVCRDQDMVLFLSATSDVLNTDEDAFPRRAAVSLLTSAILKHPIVLSRFLRYLVTDDVTAMSPNSEGSIPNEVIRSLLHVFLSKVMEDLDWEVKRNGIFFLSKIHAQLINDDRINVTKGDVIDEICAILQKQVEDCSVVVSEAAIDLLDVIHNRYDDGIEESRRCDSLLEELGNLLDDVEHRCLVRVPFIHHDNDDWDELSRDCY